MEVADPSSNGTAPSVDVFLIYNQLETAVDDVRLAIEASGLSTHYWDRDITLGAPIVEVEQHALRAARSVVILLGAAGWGPQQRALAVLARNLKKAIFPVLVGDGVDPSMMTDGGQVFLDLMRADLTGTDREAATLRLIGAIKARVRPINVDRLVALVVDGNDEQRLELLGKITAGRLEHAGALKARLATEVATRFSPAEQTGKAAAARDPRKIPSVRSWMLSVLIWLDAENEEVRRLLLQHLLADFEPESAVRFWVLAGLAQKGASYLSDAVERTDRDPAPEVALLSQVLRNPGDDTQNVIRRRLHGKDFQNEIWPALRVLRIVPMHMLAPDLCELVRRGPSGPPVAYDALYALSQPQTIRWAAADLAERVGVSPTVRIMLEILRTSDRNAARRFSGLLRAMDREQVDAAFQEASQDPELAGGAQILARLVRNDGTGGPPLEFYVAGYASDTIDVAQDALDIRQDVQSLTAVMLAKEVQPPLAIGLFGDWGAGKSFFMEAMKAATREITDRAASQANSQFCSQVVTISFNAWHYVDTNLWASLVAHIFERLAAHVSPGEAPAQQQARLQKEMLSAQAAVSDLSLAQKATQEKLAAQHRELESLQQERGSKELALRDLRLKDFRTILEADDQLAGGVKKALDEIGASAAIAKVEDLDAAITEVNTLGGRAGALAVNFLRGRIGWGAWLLISFAVLTPLVLVWAGTSPSIKAWLDQALPKLVATFAQIGLAATAAAAALRGAAAKVKVGVDKVAKAKRAVDERLAAQRAKPSDVEKDLESQIAGLRSQEDLASAKLQAATEKVLDLERQLVELNQAHSLEWFLAKRVGSEDYRKHQGLIATVRADFEALTERLRRPIGSSPAIERIVLYIDDLDRCPADQVAEVLQAVHLLLAYPLFVVVVGVDSRWLTHSLASEFPAIGDASMGGGATPQNYLEKIFQIPLRLKPMSQGGYNRLVRDLLTPTPRIVGQPVAPVLLPQRLEALADGAEALSAAAQDIDAALTRAESTTPAPPAASFFIHEEALSITAHEAEFAERLFSLLPSPRAAKRFTNLYRLLKAPMQIEDLSDFEGTEDQPGTFRTPMLLLAILIGAPVAGAKLLRSMSDQLDVGGDPYAAIGSAADTELAALSTKLQVLLKDGELRQPHELLRQWLPKVARYSFARSDRP